VAECIETWLTKPRAMMPWMQGRLGKEQAHRAQHSSPLALELTITATLKGGIRKERGTGARFGEDPSTCPSARVGLAMNDSCIGSLGRPQTEHNQVSPVSWLRRTLHGSVVTQAQEPDIWADHAQRQANSARHDDSAKLAESASAVGSAIEAFLQVHER
jgi:hypothetical protein